MKCIFLLKKLYICIIIRVKMHEAMFQMIVKSELKYQKALVDLIIG